MGQRERNGTLARSFFHLFEQVQGRSCTPNQYWTRMRLLKFGFRFWFASPSAFLYFSPYTRFSLLILCSAQLHFIHHEWKRQNDTVCVPSKVQEEIYRTCSIRTRMKEASTELTYTYSISSTTTTYTTNYFLPAFFNYVRTMYSSSTECYTAWYIYVVSIPCSLDSPSLMLFLYLTAVFYMRFERVPIKS